jgi:hypothetical protein
MCVCAQFALFLLLYLQLYCLPLLLVAYLPASAYAMVDAMALHVLLPLLHPIFTVYLVSHIPRSLLLLLLLLHTAGPALEGQLQLPPQCT